MKEQLCSAFCAELQVERVPSGWAVSTPFRQPDGDPIMFFVVTVSHGVSRIEDDGAQFALLEACGVSLDKKGARYQAFTEMLEQHGAYYDDDAGVICTADLPESEVPHAAIRFMGLMLRIHDLALLTPERVRKTWQEDALRDIHAAFDGKAIVQDNAAVSPTLASFPADAVIRGENVPPVAVFMATADTKGLQALVLKMELERYQSEKCTVLLLVERAKDNPLREATYALAQSRLDGVLTYRGAEAEAMSALSRWALPTHQGLQ